MIEIRLERKLLPNLLLDISVSVSPRRTVRKLKVGRWSDNQEHFLGAAKIPQTEKLKIEIGYRNRKLKICCWSDNQELLLGAAKKDLKMKIVTYLKR